MMPIYRDVLRVVDTYANLLTKLKEKMFGYDTTNDRLVIKKPGGTFKTISDDTQQMLLSGNQTVAGVKTFDSSPLVPTADPGDDSTKAASTAFVTAAVGSAGDAILKDGSVDFEADQSMGGFGLTDVLSVASSTGLALTLESDTAVALESSAIQLRSSDIEIGATTPGLSQLHIGQDGAVVDLSIDPNTGSSLNVAYGSTERIRVVSDALELPTLTKFGDFDIGTAKSSLHIGQDGATIELNLTPATGGALHMQHDGADRLVSAGDAVKILNVPFRFPTLTTPTVSDGDVWVESNELKSRINGVTEKILTTAGVDSSSQFDFAISGNDKLRIKSTGIEFPDEVIFGDYDAGVASSLSIEQSSNSILMDLTISGTGYLAFSVNNTSVMSMGADRLIMYKPISLFSGSPTPADDDIWIESGDVRVRIAGQTYTLNKTAV